jgi:DeoR/GlpR family transcriptional regulator of sugar metabolism
MQGDPRQHRKMARQQRIVAELAASPTVRISHLAEEFGVSTETVRRDIDELTQRGLVDRTYGGASTRHIGLQPEVDERGRLAVAERQRIGRAAAGLVQAGDVLMIDSGSTTTHFARALAAERRDITVITNGIGVASALADLPGGRILLCPGEFSGYERGVYGPETVAFLGRFHADLVFISSSGITAEGPTDVESKACWIKRTMLDRARRSVLLVDSSKFDQTYLEIVCPLGRLDTIVTDLAPSGPLGDAIAAAGTELQLAEGGGSASGTDAPRQ